MATEMLLSSSNQNQMMKFPKFGCRQVRVHSSSYNHSLSSGNSSSSSSSSSSSPSSVLPEYPKLKKKRSLLPPQPLCVDQNEVKKKMKVLNSSSSIATSAPPLSPTALHHAMIRIRFAKTIMKAHKIRLEQITSDPVKVQKGLAELKRKQLEEKERVEAQLREATDLESKQKAEDSEKERQLKQAQVERQRRRERLERDKMEAVAKCKLQQPYCCTLKQLGILTRCDHAWSWGCWGGKHLSPLEQLGLRIKEEGENDIREVELEEGEINEELEEGEIY